MRNAREGKFNWMNLAMVVEFFEEFIIRSYMLFPLVQLLQNKYKNWNHAYTKFLISFSLCLFVQNLGFFFPSLIQMTNTFTPLCYFLMDFLLPTLVYITFWKEKVTLLTKVLLGVWLGFYGVISMLFLIGGLVNKY